MMAYQIIASTNAVSAVCGAVAGGGILIFILIRALHPSAKSLSAAEANVIFCSRVGVLQILIGVAGLASSFTFTSSLLTMISGATAVGSLKSFNRAREIVTDRSSNCCCQPFQAANNAIAGIVFSFLDLTINVSLRSR